MPLTLPFPDLPIIVAFGGGTNSTAMLCGFRERDIVPAAIFFADTKGEMPHTYRHVEDMTKRVREWWGIELVRVWKTYRGEHEGLEEQCHRTGQLPSLAYGHKQCSTHFKQRPQAAAAAKLMRANKWKEITKAIGFGPDEPWRGKFAIEEYGKAGVGHIWFPLRDWNWTRKNCVAAIARHGICQPGKSRCFFCPAVKTAEVLALRQHHPDLFQRGLAIEAAAQAGRKAKHGGEGITGLHFGTKWSDIAKADDEQLKLFDWMSEHASPSQPCGCIDG